MPLIPAKAGMSGSVGTLGLQALPRRFGLGLPLDLLLLLLVALEGDPAQQHADDRRRHADDQANEQGRVFGRAIPRHDPEQQHAEARNEITGAFQLGWQFAGHGCQTASPPDGSGATAKVPVNPDRRAPGASAPERGSTEP